MSLSPRQQFQLDLIEADLIRSDPRLAVLLSQFGRPAVGGALPSWERGPSTRDRFRTAGQIMAAVTVAAALIGALIASPRSSPSRCGAAGSALWTRSATGPAATWLVPVTTAARPHPQSSTGQPTALPGATLTFADSGRPACVR